MREQLKDKIKMHAMAMCMKQHHMFDILHFIAYSMYKTGNELKYLKKHNMRVIDALKPSNTVDSDTVRGLIQSHNNTYLKESDRQKLAEHKPLYEDIIFYHEKASMLCSTVDGLSEDELNDFDFTRKCYWV